MDLRADDAATLADERAMTMERIDTGTAELVDR